MNISLSSDISRHLSLMVAISMLSMLVLLSLVFDVFSNIFVDEQRKESQALTNTAVSITQTFHGLHSQGALSLEQAEELAQEALRKSRYSDNGYFWINDLDGNIIMHPVAPHFEGKNFTSFQDIEGKKPFIDFIAQAKQGGGWVDYWWPKPNQPDSPSHKISYVSLFEPWGWVIGTGVYMDDVYIQKNRAITQSIHIFVITVLLLSLFSLVIARKSAHGIAQIAIKDPLTKLYTRRYLNETIESFIRADDRANRNHLYVLFLDIDHFKRINDCYGHLKGDMVLKKLGRLLRKHTRPEDLCVRYGGEEFLLLTSAERDEAVRFLAERLRKLAYCSGYEDDIKITLSVGIARRQEEESFINVLNRADQNLYRAKAEGRDRVIFE